MTLEKISKKYKSFDVANLQLRINYTPVEFFFKLAFKILSFLNFCEIVHFQKGGNGPPNPPPTLHR